MAGGVVGLDLEWVPDTDSDEDKQTRVALVQIASATVALLVRLNGVPALPPPLLDFLRCAGLAGPRLVRSLRGRTSSV